MRAPEHEAAATEVHEASRRAGRVFSQEALCHTTIPVVAACGLFTMAAYTTYVLHGRPLTGVDDAQIFLTYSANLAGGHGFVYNVGGPRVEGFTSLLWTVIGAFPFLVGIRPETTLLVLNVLLGCFATSAAVLYLMRDTGTVAAPLIRRGFYVYLFLLLVLASPAYVTWTTITLMDVGLWSSLLTVATLLILQIPFTSDPRRLSSAFAVLTVLLVASRPEAFVVVPALITLFATNMAASHSLAVGRTALLRLIALFLAVAAAVTVFRLLYFGYPLPNTYYAKVSPSLQHNLEQGREYLRLYIESGPLVTVGVLASLLIGGLGLSPTIRAWSGRTNAGSSATALPSQVVPALVACLVLMLPVVSGGDHFLMFRFYQPALPLVALTLVLSLREVGIHSLVTRSLGDGHGILNIMLAAGVLVAATGFVLRFAGGATNWSSLRDVRPIAHEFQIAQDGIATGRAFAGTFDPSALPSLGVLTAGGIKRAYPGVVIDLMGLNEPRMGHSSGERRGTKNHAAFNTETFWELRPQIVMPMRIGRAEVSAPFHIRPWVNFVFRGLFGSERFRDEYRCAAVARAGHSDDVVVCGFFRADLLLSLEQDARYRVWRLEAVVPGETGNQPDSLERRGTTSGLD